MAGTIRMNSFFFAMVLLTHFSRSSSSFIMVFSYGIGILKGYNVVNIKASGQKCCGDTTSFGRCCHFRHVEQKSFHNSLSSLKVCQ